MKALSFSLLAGAFVALVGCAGTTTSTSPAAHNARAVGVDQTTAVTESAHVANAAADSKSRSATEHPEYESVDVAGFTARLAPAAQRHPKRQEALAAIATRLTNLQSAFPAAAREDLKRTTSLWFTERTTSSGPLFHPDAGTGTGTGTSVAHRGDLPKPELANGIEIPSITLLLELLELRDTKTQDVLANLLAASYFMHLPAPPWREAEEAFTLAKTNLITAKLGSDPLSYFSALSAAYFGKCSLPPDRAALRAADPRGVDLVARTWHLPTDRLAQR